MKLDIKSRKIKALVLVSLLMMIIIGISFLDKVMNKSTQIVMSNQSSPITGTALSKGQTEVDLNFTTHLPLVVFDTGEQEPRIDSIWSDSEGYQIPADYDPYAQGEIFLIDNEDGINSLSDEAILESQVKMRLRGNSSASFPKKQYLLKLYYQNGQKNEQDILGMGKDWEWILNISWHDSSLIRNYLAYTLFKDSEVLSPDAQYCEVVRRNGDRYEYLGVYLLMENAEHSKDRIDNPDYSPNQTLSYILRRDRYDETAIILNTEVEGREPLEGSLEVKYPSEDVITTTDIHRIEEEIIAFEDVLFAEDNSVFMTYPQHIDVESFVDYFVYNEFFMNYDAGFNSTYMYKDHTGKLKMGPFWDFDQAIANDKEFDSKLNTTAFHNAPWFKQLLRDPNFVKKIEDRYHELRTSVLSDETISQLIKNTVNYLGPAAQRDWNRWEYELNQNASAKGAKVVSFSKDVENVQNILRIHGTWLDRNIDSLYQFSDSTIPVMMNEEMIEEQANFYADLLAVVYISAFLISVILIRRDI